jgi:plastocyanin
MPAFRWATVSIVIGLSVALPGCGGDDDDDGGGTRAPAPAANVPISETDFRLDPSRVDLDQPGKVRFAVTNDGKTVHALEVEGPEGEVETDDLQPGKSATLVAELGEPGSFVMYCPVANHRELGMEGKVVVGGAEDGSGPKQDDSGAGGY